LIYDDPFDYLSNGTSSQVEQTKKTSMTIGFLVKLNIYSSWIICKLINDQCIIRNHTTTKNETLTNIYVVKHLMKELFDIFFVDCQTL